MTIRTRVILETVLILAFVVSGTGFTFISVREQRIALDRVGLAADTVANRSIALIKAAKDIKLDVVQVQQFLTDISATRAQDGLDDGFKVAQEFAERFEHDAETAVGLAESLHRQEMIRLLTETKAVFTPYYETGRRMAQGLHRRRSGAGQSTHAGGHPIGEIDTIAGSIASPVEAQGRQQRLRAT
jgi:methyl-accepting chemotaxis protein